MSIKDLFNKVKKEAEVLQGNDTKDKEYGHQNTFPDEAAAAEAFERSKVKLFAVDKWSDLPGIRATFAIYDAGGQKFQGAKPREGDYIQVILPGLPMENWVQVVDLREEEALASFMVRPSPAPAADDKTKVKHFFTSEATSTFQVARDGLTIWGREIGKNEKPNNQEEASAGRAMVNTLVAEGGWAGFQKVQWDKVTAYLVHLLEVEG